MPFDLDASIAALWASDDEDHPLAAVALKRIRTDPAIVPSVWWFEVRKHADREQTSRTDWSKRTPSSRRRGLPVATFDTALSAADLAEGIRSIDASD